tara:strand:+ start:1765 stop:2643 length:879 start_codon:yes stop_codon:yes gene_type:complete
LPISKKNISQRPLKEINSENNLNTNDSINLIKLDSKGGHLIDKLSNDYWNNKEIERNKIFNVSKIGFNDLENSAKYNNLLNHIDSLFIKQNIDFNNKNILSIASGICWIESKIFNNNKFNSLSCNDISLHRIHELAPKTLNHYGINKNVNLLHGNIFDIGNATKAKYDLVFLCQAFHHIDEPIRLLRIMNDVMSNNGVIFITGEHYYSSIEYHKRAIKHFIKYLINYKNYRHLNNFYPSWQDLFRPSFSKGDIHWSLNEYNFIFKKSGFDNYYHYISKCKRYQSFILKKSEN